MIKRDRIKLIKEMLSSNSTDPFLNYAAALEYNKIGDKEKSINLLLGIVNNNPEYLGAYYQLGKLYEEQNQSDKAIVIFKKGRKVALEQNNQKTLGELTEALMLVDDEFDGSFD
ncbi:MAG: tetratricopeptide repeat protein [Crocinitomicaceae bacterium]|nr:tetratricopeptide repeat protein [Crocinitomicaceae bacterium]|tara:strand:+ start:5317 stop:5658 length:342 start_codon:yes stop_codon:yes gene_type:complete